MDKLPDFEPVKISCSATDCENDKHCYRPKRGQWTDDGIRGECQACGDTNVDMSVTLARKADDPASIFDQLGREFIRDIFLERAIDEQGRRQIRREGVLKLRSRVRQHLATRIGKKPDNFDGRQTPFQGSILNFAQHSTATCCRRCLYYWYGIPMDRALNPDELDFCERMVLAYLDRRAGELEAIETEGAKPAQ